VGKDEIHAPLVADGAAAASAQTLDAIERAAEMNEDPAVAEVLEDASIAADTTLTRVGWVRTFLHRLFGSSTSSA
jgi:hypothetical protein